MRREGEGERYRDKKGERKKSRGEEGMKWEGESEENRKTGERDKDKVIQRKLE